MKNLNDHWQITKPVVHSQQGVVASQHVSASQVGIEVLAAGGNAVDAAVATAMTLGVVEPWMSGIGGCGYMMIYLAKERRVQVVDFSTQAPAGLDPTAFPIIEQATDADLFGWPMVEGYRNVHGPLSIGLPGTVDGLALALDNFGTLPWREVLAPAIAQAKLGHPLTWWTTLKVAGEATALRVYPGAAEVYLPNGLPPLPGELERLHLNLDPLAATLEQLARAGARDFYEGEIAHSLASDVAAAGGWLSDADLTAYHARLREPQSLSRKGAELHLLTGLNAGPTYARALANLPESASGTPSPEAYAAMAQSLHEAYTTRFATLGHDGDLAGHGSTTHLAVADREGNMVSLTNTLLSLFGSNLRLPGSGVLMNNGIMWFDPRPGQPNSIAAGKPPLCNICPVIATRKGAPWFAMGASGGRRILPAVFQLASFMIDGGLDLESAAHLPRLNIDGGSEIQADDRLNAATFRALEAALGPQVPVRPVPASILPNLFANPVAVAKTEAGLEGMAQIPSPVAAACGL